jgi:hypothetical protein
MALGVNLEGMTYYSEEQPFLNTMLTASDWFGYSNKLTLDSSGYPIGMSGNKEICTQTLFGHNFSGQYYIIRYSGDGVHALRDAGTITRLSYATGSIIDTTPGRLVLKTGGGPGSLGICLTSDDPKATGNYIRNIAIIDCGASPTNCVNESLWYRCSAVNHACLNPAWEKAFGTKRVGGPGFTSYRFMDWMRTNLVSDGDWDHRSIPDYFSYSASREITGVPLEVILSVLNTTCADGWINVPAAGLSVISDASASASVKDGTLTVVGVAPGKISVGDYLVSAFDIVASISGNVMTVTQVRSGYISVGAVLTWNGRGVVTGQTSGAIGEVGTYTLSQDQTAASKEIQGANAPLGTYIASGGTGDSKGGTYRLKNSQQDLNRFTVAKAPFVFAHLDTSYITNMANLARATIRWCGSSQRLRIEVGNEPWNYTKYGYSYFGSVAQKLWGIGGVDGGYAFRGMITAIAGQIFKETFGTEASHIESVLCVQPVTNTYYATDGGKLLIAPYWNEVPAYKRIDALTISDYYTIGERNLPYNWLALPDAGLSKLYKEVMEGGQVNDQISKLTQTSGEGYGSCGHRCGYIPVSTVDGKVALCDFTAKEGHLNCSISNAGENFSKGDTLSVSNHFFAGSGQGWSAKVEALSGPDSDAKGLLQENRAMIEAWKAFAAKYGLKLLAYEGGEQLLLAGGASPMTKLICAWDGYHGAQMVTFDLLNDWRQIAGTSAEFHYFTDTNKCAYPSSWGLAYTPNDTASAAKYQGALQQLR